MKKYLIFLIILALFIGCVNAEDVNLDDSYVENEISVNSHVLNENSEQDHINENEKYEYGYDFNETLSDEDLDSLELNTTGVVMSDDEYSCGAASFATVVNNLGMNISLSEAKYAVNTTVNGTTMGGIINGANRYNLTAYGISVNIMGLNENYIVHISMNGTNHWSVVKEVLENNIILADSSWGIINFTKDEFSKIYTNNAIIISKSYIDLNILKSNNIELISDHKKLLISGKAKWITKKSKYKQWSFYKWGIKWRWVYETKHCSPYRMGNDYIYVYQYSTYKYGKWNKLW